MELEMKWLDQINEEIKNNGPTIAYEKEQWEKPSIYKVPSQVTELNKNAFKPQAISFGPYHYGEENLKLMEKHKHRALLHFLKRCGKPVELLFQRLNQVAKELKDSYKSLDPIWTNNTPKFIEMMILDGCFILEILKVNYESEILVDYDKNDHVFGEHGKLHLTPYIKRDMLILENQIPMTVLHILTKFETNVEEEDHRESLKEKIIKFLDPWPSRIIKNTSLFKTKIIRLGKCTHLLDLYRKSMIQENASHTTPSLRPPMRNLLNCEEPDEDYIIRSARELQEAGVRFKKSDSRSLKDVSFNRGVLRLPAVKLDDSTKYIFLNLIAFERLHVGAGNEVTSFICFMDTIIDTAQDVPFLSRSGILINALGNDKLVAKLFNSLAKEISMDRNGELDMVMTNMKYYCEKPWKSWRASLIQTYFRNPWAMVSLVAAFFLFALTIIQTIYTVGQFYQKDC
ncbi:hypothetical protein MtrunA17_Chr5g0439641 [Medicago truncatula]|uniref:DUF247 domain protein n=1 Tax=Medicago truncatula TaxID=3880 RepID=A0A396HXR1_MEDTR|nr:UPF0481 protein At3g47200-like [Medicago truncatula]RHN57371.1 hypothetical protein MtrunA17_Chr5g0439641 [Medicago truncatula]